MGHYGDMAALALAIAIGCLIGSTSMAGSAFVAGVTAVSSIYIGVGAILYPDYSSSPGALVGTLVIGAALFFGWSSIIAGSLRRVVQTHGVAA